MDIRVLRYFLAIAQEKNITKAAEILHIAQPSLSKQMMDLENEIGKTLFIRGKRGVSLTEEGKFLSKRAEEIISLLEKTEKELTSDSKNISGTISIGGGIGSNLITKTAVNLTKKYPEINYNLFSYDAEEVTEALENGTLDFGVLIEPVDILKYDYISLPEKNCWGILMRTDDPLAEKNYVSQKDIKNLPLIICKRTGIHRELTRWLNEKITDLNIIAMFNVINSSASLFVKNGLGYAVTLSTLEYDKEELCFRPFFPKYEIQFCIVWKRNRPFSKPAEKFIEELKKLINSY